MLQLLGSVAVDIGDALGEPRAVQLAPGAQNGQVVLGLGRLGQSLAGGGVPGGQLCFPARDGFWGSHVWGECGEGASIKLGGSALVKSRL